MIKAIMIGRVKILLFCLYCLCMPLSAQALRADITADDDVSAEIIRDVKDAVKMTEDFYISRYGLDTEQPAQVFLVSNKLRYISTIVYELDITREAAEKYHNKSGATRGNKIILNIAGTNRDERLINTMHELTHRYQLLLSGNSTDIMWLSEGVADVMAISVLSDNELGSLSKYQEQQLLFLTKAPRVPRLAELYNEDNWYKAANEAELAVNYSIARSAVLYLVSTVGFEPLITYYHLLGDNKDADEAFKKAFGLSVKTFEAEFSEYLAQYGIEN